MFDTTGLTEVKMKVYRGYQGSYFTDGDECVAKTCSGCRRTLGADNFAGHKRKRYGLADTCRDCRKLSNAKRTGVMIGDRKQSAIDTQRKFARWKIRTESECDDDFGRLRPHGLKKCYRCAQYLPRDNYYRNRLFADGREPECRACDIETRAERKVQRLRKHWSAKSIPFDQCIYCQMMTDLTPGDLHGDHVIPKARGGSDDLSNLAPACYACNICKGDTPVSEFLDREFFYEEDREEIRERLAHYGYKTT